MRSNATDHYYGHVRRTRWQRCASAPANQKKITTTTLRKCAIWRTLRRNWCKNVFAQLCPTGAGKILIVHQACSVYAPRHSAPTKEKKLQQL
jgi:hypothetical protein